MDRVKGLQWMADLRYTASKYIPMVSYKKLFFWEWAKGPLFLLAALG